MSVHAPTWKWMRCPHCGTWQRFQLQDVGSWKPMRLVCDDEEYATACGNDFFINAHYEIVVTRVATLVSVEKDDLFLQPGQIDTEQDADQNPIE